MEPPTTAFVHPYNFSWKFGFENGSGAWQLTEAVFGPDRTIVFVVSIGYVAFILAMQQMWKPFPQVRARVVLTLWNCILSLASFLVVARLAPEIAMSLNRSGFQMGLRSFPSGEAVSIIHFWLVVNFWCKVFELGDTVFLVLRKRPLTFFHVFHHATTLMLVSVMITLRGCWWFYRIYATLNSFVHILMYAYFGASSWGIKVPKYVAQAITIVQIMQMSTFLFLISLGIKLAAFIGAPVVFPYILLILTIINLALFTRYYLRTYVYVHSTVKKKAA